MKYITTRNKEKEYSFSEAVIKGLAEDGGLFFPKSIPKLPKEFFDTIEEKSFTQIAHEVSHLFIDDIPADTLNSIIDEAINFPAPVVKLSDDISILELFHGNTLAFKDFGARFLAGVLSFYLKSENKKCTILVATSGDTGSAVASGFFNKDNIDVVILYPSGKVSNIQEQQLCTFNNNIFAFEVDGTFDDCQRLVKAAFLDTELSREHFLTSANSINIGRLVPQSFYYFNAWKQAKNYDSNIIFTVPSGNLGNLTSGLIAKEMGLPVSHFVSALNKNDVFKKFLDTGKFIPIPSFTTISNAMDVGNPSNLERIRYMFNDNIAQMKSNIHVYSFDDNETKVAIQQTYSEYNYILDPHGAVGYLAAQKDKTFTANKSHYIVLETAHPAKFSEESEPSVSSKITIPPRLEEFLHKKKNSIKISKDYDTFKKEITRILLSR
jgi:threonine synthase